MKTLIIFAFAVLISFSNSQSLSSTTNFKCPDDKIKIGEDVCAIESSKDGTTEIPNVVYVKKKSCGKKKECKVYGSSNSYYNKDTPADTKGSRFDTIYTCQKVLKLLKIKKKCNYNAECYSGFCDNGKCAAYGDIDCKGNDNSCGAGKSCVQTGTSSSGSAIYKCTDYAKLDGNCKTADCAPGLGDFWSSDYSTCTCKKYYSLDQGDEIYSNSQKFCKSYYAPKGKCAEIISIDETTCDIKYKDDGDGTDTDNTLTTIGTKNYCKKKSGIKELISDLVERYNKIKLDKILEKENCDYAPLCDKKFAELSAVVDDYGPLLYHGIIKENGKKDKKCEYEFWRTVTVSSSYINICLLFAFTLLSLLF